MLIDTHQHFWNSDLSRYGWMTGPYAKLRRPHTPNELRAELCERTAVRTIVVQARNDLEETADLLSIANANDFVAGVVGWVDLTDADLSATLTKLNALPGGAKLVGLRHPVHDEDDPQWLLQPAVQANLARLAVPGLTFDLLVRTRELPAAVETARRHPGVRFIVDHLAKPDVSSGRLDAEWSIGIEELASLPNVICKVSGLVTEADWTSWKPADFMPYIAHAAEQFGAERLLIGSDWPVCLLAASYADALTAYVTCLRNLGIEPIDTCARNAQAVYGIDPGRQPDED